MLLGIAAKNSILLVEFAIEHERLGATRKEALAEARRERTRPILMTTYAMAAGMLPGRDRAGRGLRGAPVDGGRGHRRHGQLDRPVAGSRSGGLQPGGRRRGVAHAAPGQVGYSRRPRKIAPERTVSQCPKASRVRREEDRLPRCASFGRACGDTTTITSDSHRDAICGAGWLADEPRPCRIHQIHDPHLGHSTRA